MLRSVSESCCRHETKGHGRLSVSRGGRREQPRVDDNDKGQREIEW